MRPSNLPEDVLIIHYATLSPESLAPIRLQVLAAIGRLLNEPHQSHRLENLLADVQAQNALHTWLAGEEAGKFWHSVNGEVSTQRICEKHLLVGTRQLMEDLALLGDEAPSYELATLEVVWQAADSVVNQLLKRGEEEL